MMQQVNHQGQQLPNPVPSNNIQQLTTQSVHSNIGSTGMQDSSSLSSALPPGSALQQPTMTNVAGQRLKSQNIQNMSGGAVGESTMESDDWRGQLQADSQERIMNKIVNSAKRHYPSSGDEGLHDLKKKAARFEEKIYTDAKSQSDYLRKISLKIITLEDRSKNPMLDPLQSNSTANGVNSSDRGSALPCGSGLQQPTMANVAGQNANLQTIQNMSSIQQNRLIDSHIIQKQRAMKQVNHQGRQLPNLVPSNNIQQLTSQSIHSNIGSAWMQDSSSLSSALPPGSALQQPNMTNVAGQSLKSQNIQNMSHGAVGDHTMESGDWRAQLQADSRERIVYKMVNSVKRHYPSFGDDDLKKKAVMFEEKIYTAAKSQSDYLQKICLKMIMLEDRSKNPMSDPLQSNSTANGVNSSDPGSALPRGSGLQQPTMANVAGQNANLLNIKNMSSIQQNRLIDSHITQKQRAMPDASSRDWQEEVYQKIKALKDLYLPDLNDMHQKILSYLQQLDSVPQQPKDERLEKLKVFKDKLEHLMQILQVPKHGILDSYKDKLDTFVQQIIMVVNSNRPKPAAPQQKSLLQSQQTHSQSTQVQPHKNKKARVNKLPKKLPDPGSFTIPCSVGGIFVSNALADTGASVNVMPTSMFKKLNLGEPIPTTMRIRLGDRSLKCPRGIAKDLLAKVGKFEFPADFVILDMEEGTNVLLVLGRPFLATSRAVVDMSNKRLTLRVGKEVMKFGVGQRVDENPLHFVEAIDFSLDFALEHWKTRGL